MIKRSIIIASYLMLAFMNAYTQEYDGFRVVGRHLYDRCGEKVILRGVANPNIWFETNGIPRYAEIAQTNANIVRIVWTTAGSALQLDEAITNCINEQMIPMVELHDATGDWSRLQTCINYWVRSDVIAIIQKHENYLIVNIANECGNYNVTNTTFRTGYEAAIIEMRNAGIHVPLVIDGTDWGKNVNILQAEGPYLINADPDHNLIFSVHMWWPQMYGFTESDIVNEIAQSVGMNLPLIVGEFSQMHGDCDEDQITATNSIAYKTIIRECQENEVGYIAWSWFGNCNPFWDMSSNGTFNALYDWGLEVAVTDVNSIDSTSIRPYSIVYGTCNTTGIKDPESDFSGSLILDQNFPNPFSTTTSISYILSMNSQVKLTVCDYFGKEILTLVNTYQTMGNYTVDFDAKNLPGGLYFYTLKAGKYCESRKMVLIK
jgi:mannan endo-1,4-beta-mannosidase